MKKNKDSAVSILNEYRNRHYNAPLDTEENRVANAINKLFSEIFSTRTKNHLYRGTTISYDEISYYGNLVVELSTGRTFLLDVATVNDDTLWKDIAVEVDPQTVELVLDEDMIKDDAR